MLQKLALDTLITVLSCLTPPMELEQFPIDLHKYNFKLADESAFCKVKNNTEQKVFELELQKEENERNLLLLEYKLLNISAHLDYDEDYTSLYSISQFRANQSHPSDCTHLKYGVYSVQISPKIEPLYTVCDDTMLDGNWMLILQHIRNSSQNQKPTWHESMKGYGHVYENYFIGIEKIEELGRKRQQEILIVLSDKTFQTKYAIYDKFNINDAAANYTINSFGNCRGNACGIKLQKDDDKDHMDMECLRKNENENKNKTDWWDFSCMKNAQLKIFLRPKLK